MKHGFIRTAAAVVAAAFLCAGSANAAQFQGSVSAKSAILVDADSGRVLFEKNADERSLIASTTKIMTGLLVCEAGDLAREISVPPEAAGVEGSSLYLKAGERITVKELLYGLMLRSGNDAAVALAIATAGSVDTFVSRMNEKAQALGLEHTHFENPNGLDGEEHFSTARDLSKLCVHAMENETFRTVVSSKSFTEHSRSFTNHNKLLWRVEGADGVKTGYTKKAGRILAGSATRDGQRLICVTICDPDDWRDQQALLDYGFSEFPARTIVTAGRDGRKRTGRWKQNAARFACDRGGFFVSGGRRRDGTDHFARAGVFLRAGSAGCGRVAGSSGRRRAGFAGAGILCADGGGTYARARILETDIRRVTWSSGCKKFYQITA